MSQEQVADPARRRGLNGLRESLSPREVTRMLEHNNETSTGSPPPSRVARRCPTGHTWTRARTEVPLELDHTDRSLDEPARALGPRGANADGALSRLLTESTANLRGPG